MIIQGLNINGFGIFSGMEVNGFSPGLNIVLGDNETGKSTILAFLRVMLFGFPRNIAGTNSYPPLHGGTHGGSLTLASEKGPVILTRSPGSYGGKVAIAYPDGSKGGGDELLHLLGGTTSTVYNNVYAFSLSELETIQSLTNEEVASALYGASLGTGVRSLSNARKRISQRRGDLFKPTGKKPEINQKISEFKENAALITQAAKDADIYQASVEEIVGLEEELKILKGRVKKLNREIQFCKNIISLWDDWIDYSQAFARLKDLPADIIVLPENYPAKFESLSEKIEAAVQDVTGLKEETKEQNAKAESLEVEKSLVEQEKLILGLNAEHAGYRQNQENHQYLSNQIELKHNEIEAICTSLGESWTKESLAEFQGSLFLKQDLDKHQQAIKTSVEERQQANSQLEPLKNNFLELQDEEARRESAIEKIGEHDASWESAFSEGHDPLADARSGGRDLQDLISRQEKMDQDLTHQQQRMGDTALFAWRRGRFILAAALFFLFISAGIGLMALKMPWYFSFGAMVFGFALSGFLTILVSKGQPSEKFKQKLALRDLEYARMTKDQKALLQSIQTFQRQKDTLAAMLKLAQPVTHQAVAEFITQTDQETERFRSWCSLRANLEETRAKGAAAQKRLDSAQAKTVEAETHEKNCISKWQEWLKSQRLPESLSTDSAREALASIDKGSELLRIIANDQRSLDACLRNIEAFEGSLGQLVESLGLPYPEPGMVQAMLRDLGLRLEKSKENIAVRAQIKSSISVLENRIKDRTGYIESLRNEQKSLLASADANNEQDFLKKCDLSDERRALEGRIENAVSAMGKISGEKDIERLVDILETMDRDSCHIRLREAEESLIQADDKFQEQNTRLAELRAEIKHLASDTRVSLLRAKEEELTEQIRSLALQWGAYTLAGTFLERAVSFLEQEQQPEVITRAGSLFSEVTGGRYTKIYAPLGESNIELVMQDGTRKSPEQLSRGTAELLYLCLRMGYIQTRATQGANLPVVMDDVLVNFDANRATQAANAISGLARGHQVFLFTCHQNFLDLFKNESPSLQIYTLSNGKMVPA